MNCKIQFVHVINFKTYNDTKIIFNNKNQIIIGENDSGKSSILEALDYFFNKEEIPIEYVRDTEKDVIVSILINRKYYSKRFKKKNKTFKLSYSSENIKDISQLSYIFIPSNSQDIEKVIQELALIRIKDNIPKELLKKISDIADEKFQEILNVIDPTFMVTINEDTENTLITGRPVIKIEKAFSFNFNSNGEIPLKGRGSGYKKTVLYSLLIDKKYENTILAIDEIENSLSISSVSKLLKIIQNFFAQTLITTHSVTVLNAASISFNIYPILSTKNESVTNLLSSIDPTIEKKFLIVEGKTDCNWILKVLDLLNKYDEYIVIPGGGSGSLSDLKDALTQKGLLCHYIYDGDVKHKYSLKREIIEMYAPVQVINQLFGLNLTSLSTDKSKFWNQVKTNKGGESYIKRELSNWALENLDISNPLVTDVKEILECQN